MKQSQVEQMFDDILHNVPVDSPWPRSQFKLLIVMDERLPNVFEDHGVTVDGYSWSYGSPYGTFCLRVTYKGERWVALTSGRKASLCLQKQLELLSEGRLPLKADKYRGNLTGKVQVV